MQVEGYCTSCASNAKGTAWFHSTACGVWSNNKPDETSDTAVVALAGSIPCSMGWNMTQEVAPSYVYRGQYWRDADFWEQPPVRCAFPPAQHMIDMLIM